MWNSGWSHTLASFRGLHDLTPRCDSSKSTICFSFYIDRFAGETGQSLGRGCMPQSISNLPQTLTSRPPLSLLQSPFPQIWTPSQTGQYLPHISFCVRALILLQTGCLSILRSIPMGSGLNEGRSPVTSSFFGQALWPTSLKMLTGEHLYSPTFLHPCIHPSHQPRQ